MKKGRVVASIRGKNYTRLLEQLLGKIPHKSQVSFALDCAKSVRHLVHSQDKKVVDECLKTVEAWLIGKATVEDCHRIANITYDTARDTMHNIYPTETKRAHTAYSACFAAYTVYDISNKTIRGTPVSSAVRAAANATISTSDNTFLFVSLEYYFKLVKSIKEMPELDRIIYDINIEELVDESD